MAKCAAALCAAASLAGCTKSVYVPVESVVRDSVYDSRVRVDTVISRDSVYLSERGDTVVKEVWRWRVRSRLRVDTVFRTKMDTVPVIVPSKGDKEETGASAHQSPWWWKALEGLVWLTRFCFLFLVVKISWKPVKRLLKIFAK